MEQYILNLSMNGMLLLFQFSQSDIKKLILTFSLTYMEDFIDILLIYIDYFGLKYICVLFLSVIECKSIVMKWNYVMHLKHGLIVM